MAMQAADSSEFLTISGTYFHCGDVLPLHFRGSDPFTLEGWIGFREPAIDKVSILSKPGELTLGLTAKGELFVRRHAWQSPLVGRTALRAGVWHHVGVTFDGSAIELYLNGIRDVRRFGYQIVRDAPLGDAAPAELLPFAGELWNLRFWNVARKPAEMFRATWSGISEADALVASFFPEPPSPARRRLGRTDNPPRMPLAA